MRYREEPYRTPPGTLDAPFVYVYDASALTDGQTYQDVAKSIQGDSDFVLRVIRGLDTVLAAAPNGKFSYKNPNGSYCDGQYALGGQAASRGVVMPKNWPVVPEKLYGANTSIRFDLYDVLRAANCERSPVYYSQIAFCGVKRFPSQQGYSYGQTTYAWRPLKYGYTLPLTIDWAYSAGATPQRFIVPMEQYDFELQRISICAASGTAGALATADFQVMLYDANMHQLSDLPLNQGFLNNGKVAANQAPQYQAIFPVPPLVYPQSSNITLDITSLLCSDEPQDYSLLFDGIWRVPVGRYDR